MRLCLNLGIASILVTNTKPGLVCSPILFACSDLPSSGRIITYKLCGYYSRVGSLPDFLIFSFYVPEKISYRRYSEGTDDKYET